MLVSVLAPRFSVPAPEIVPLLVRLPLMTSVAPEARVMTPGLLAPASVPIVSVPACTSISAAAPCVKETSELTVRLEALVWRKMPTLLKVPPPVELVMPRLP